MRPCSLIAATLMAGLGVGCGSAAEPGTSPELDCSFATNALFAGASRNAIPSLTLPEITGANASFMRDSDRVLGVVVNGAARAYPLGILWWHEVVNDTLGGDAVLVTYCPLTGSGIAFDPTVAGHVRSFGVSGLLYFSNLVMFDRRQGSLWNQMLLGSQCGPDRGAELTRLPIVETDWSHWRNLYPNTTVLTPNTGFVNRAYFAYPYGNYADPDNPVVDFLPPGVTWSRARLPKELILGVFDGSATVAYPLRALADSGVSFVVNDTVGTTPVLVAYVSQWNTAQAFDRRLNGQALTFTMTSAGPLTMRDAETGSDWNVKGEATAGALTGGRLRPLPDAFVSFWFAWSIYHPDTEIYH